MLAAGAITHEQVIRILADGGTDAATSVFNEAFGFLAGKERESAGQDKCFSGKDLWSQTPLRLNAEDAGSAKFFEKANMPFLCNPILDRRSNDGTDTCKSAQFFFRKPLQCFKNAQGGNGCERGSPFRRRGGKEGCLSRDRLVFL